MIGRRIGFTNRTIWAEYAVYAPMWGFVFDTTVRDLLPSRQAAQHPFTLAPFAEPRIEPEIVFRLAAAPSRHGRGGAVRLHRLGGAGL